VVESTAGIATSVFTRADDRLVSLHRPASGTTRYYHADGLGSVRLLTDESNNVTDRYTYTAFGVEIAHTGTDVQPYQFAGEPYDPNAGFYYNRARWLDVAVGRFVSVDQFAGLLIEPQTLHRYTYVQANPVNFLDPSGRITGVTNIAATAALTTGFIGGFINAVGAQSPREFAGRFLIGAFSNVAATYLAFLVVNPLAQGAIAGGLAQVFSLVW